MPEIILLGFVLAATPGPDFLLMTRNTLSHGKGFGFITLLGNRCSASIRLLGACYLIYLGIQKIIHLLRSKKSTHDSAAFTITKVQAFRMGFLSNFLNPKVSLFFLSIFPQFASTEQLQNPFLLIICFLLGNSAWYVGTLLLVGMKQIRKIVVKFQSYLDVVFGFVFLIYGGKIVWDDVLRKITFSPRLY